MMLIIVITYVHFFHAYETAFITTKEHFIRTGQCHFPLGEPVCELPEGASVLFFDYPGESPIPPPPPIACPSIPSYPARPPAKIKKSR